MLCLIPSILFARMYDVTHDILWYLVRSTQIQTSHHRRISVYPYTKWRTFVEMNQNLALTVAPLAVLYSELKYSPEYFKS